MIISLYARGMTIRDIQSHLESTLSTHISADTISQVCDSVLDEVIAWQNRPLDDMYPIMFIDAMVVKIREGNHVKNKAANIIIGVDIDGIKHVLGVWITPHEGAKGWANIFTELTHRGVKDAVIICCDGLTGIDEAIRATWWATTVQTCVVHLIRAALKYVPYKDRRQVAKEIKPIYTAHSIDHAEMELHDFKNSDLGIKYPQVVAVFERAWEKFIPFLSFGPATRKMIYTTNAIESLNYQIRKFIKTKGHFPTEQAAIKMLWLAITTIEETHNRTRKKKNRKDGHIEGHKSPHWIEVITELHDTYPEKLAKYL